MRRSLRLAFVAAILGVIRTAGAEAQAASSSPSRPYSAEEARAAKQARIDAANAADRARLGPSIYGGQCCEIMQIPAAAFRKADSYPGSWIDGIDHGYKIAGDDSGSIAIAPVILPNGVRIRYLDLYWTRYQQGSIIAVLSALRGGGLFTGEPTWEYIVAASENGDVTANGYAQSQLVDYRVNNDVSYDPEGAQLHVIVDVSPGGGFKAVDLWWQRDVSPPPDTATFNDVPTNHPFFQFVEALSASQITAGCSADPPLFCPDAPLTRKQMAAFLAKALGLHWPN